MPSLMQLICLVCILAGPLSAAAQDYPSRPIKFVVPFPPVAQPTQLRVCWATRCPRCSASPS